MIDIRAQGYGKVNQRKLTRDPISFAQRTPDHAAIIREPKVDTIAFVSETLRHYYRSTNSDLAMRCSRFVQGPNLYPLPVTCVSRVCFHCRWVYVLWSCGSYGLTLLDVVTQVSGLRGGAARSEESEEEFDESDDLDDIGDGLMDEEDFGEANFIDRLKQDWRKTPVITRTFFQVRPLMHVVVVYTS